MKGLPIEQKIALFIVGLSMTVMLAQAKDASSDCEKTIQKIIAADGAVHPWTQWTHYSEWTHQEQCSEELANLK